VYVVFAIANLNVLSVLAVAAVCRKSLSQLVISSASDTGHGCSWLEIWSQLLTDLHNNNYNQ
jgi:hypothetical protein